MVKLLIRTLQASFNNGTEDSRLFYYMIYQNRYHNLFNHWTSFLEYSPDYYLISVSYFFFHKGSIIMFHTELSNLLHLLISMRAQHFARLKLDLSHDLSAGKELESGRNSWCWFAWEIGHNYVEIRLVNPGKRSRDGSMGCRYAAQRAISVTQPKAILFQLFWRTVYFSSRSLDSVLAGISYTFSK